MGALFDAVMKLQRGMTVKQLEAEYRATALKNSKQKGKRFGKCSSCKEKTCLVADIGLCGPCCFGESSTINGNW